jgi:hypothetical protein
MLPEERAILIAEIVAAVRIRASDVDLSQDEQRWVRMAIQREAERAALRKAVIEKTLAALIWSGLLALGTMVASWSVQHGFKP